MTKELIVSAARRAGISARDVEMLSKEAIKLLKSRGIEKPTDNQFLDALEHVAMIWSSIDDRWHDFAKYLLLLRIFREAGKELGELKDAEKVLTYQAIRLLYARYLLKDELGRVKETPNDAFRRVANFIALAESRYSNPVDDYASKFYDVMSKLKFIPNSPTIMNAATRRHQLAACFVVPLEDDTNAILDALRVTVLLHKTGAGVGFDFSPLRPRGDVIRGTGGHSSGPVSFMRLFDTAADVIKEGGKRRGAMMAILHDWHPDIELFIKSKCGEKRIFENFNISVGVHDSFMEAVKNNDEWFLYNPRTCPEVKTYGPNSDVLSKCKPWSKTNATKLFELIVKCAWRSGDPGMVFLDTINKHNPTPSIGNIHATNPCGETPLLDWEACNLGSINLRAFIRNGKIDWDDLEETVKLAVRFLDDVIDMSWYPDPRIEEAVLRTRKVGLGVMGFADLLAELGIRYDSHDALYLADKLMEFIAFKAREASNELALERGPYPTFNDSIHAKGRFNWEPQVPANEIYDESRVSDYVKELVSDRPPIDWESLRREMVKGTRNATVTTIAPTGSISIIAGVNSSIEPFFALVYVRESTIGMFIEVNNYLKKFLSKLGKLTTDVLIKIAKGRKEVLPRKYLEVLRTAHDIDPEWHIRVQAVFQRWVDNAVSKTVNLRYEASEEDVRKAFLIAWRLGCKGVTVFRDRSKPEQVIKIGESVEEILKSVPKKFIHKDKIYHRWFRIGKEEIMVASEEYAGGCPTCEL